MCAWRKSNDYRHFGRRATEPDARIGRLSLGLEFYFYEPNAESCACGLGPRIQADYQDFDNLKKFADAVDVITFENENIPVKTLQFLQQYKPVYPGIEALRTSQDRLFEKTLFQELGIPTTEFMPVNNADDLTAAIVKMGYPVILKKRTHGYDGKGQLKINTAAQLQDLQTDLLSNSIVEKWVSFDREVSLIAVRNPSGQTVFYDICENVHNNGILFTTKNKINDPDFELARGFVLKLLDKFQYVGTIALEFFQVGARLIANEIAPRVHNSGHWTIEGAVISQFENHLRAILNWPLGDCSSLGYATMYNILGQLPDKIKLLQDGRVHLHDYHKLPKPGRKIGHYTKIMAD